MYNEVITLVSKTYTLDEYGDVSATLSTREVFARIRSIGMKEKYEALQAGLNPEYTFILPDYYEYDNEDEIQYNDDTYRVIRTYRNGKELEIVVTRDASVEPEPTPTPTPDPEPDDEEVPDGGTEPD